jgi:uncharacterized membrane protein
MKEFLQGRWLGHPLHALLVHVPTAVWPAALVFDLLTWFGVGGVPLVRTSFYAIAFGLLVALLAVPTGLADWLDIKPERPARRLGLIHMVLNLTVWAIFALNLGLRWNLPPETAAVPGGLVALSALGVAILAVSGYLGGRMVYEHGISVARVSKDKWRRQAELGGANVPAKEKG